MRLYFCKFRTTILDEFCQNTVNDRAPKVNLCSKWMQVSIKAVACNNIRPKDIIAYKSWNCVDFATEWKFREIKLLINH